MKRSFRFLLSLLVVVAILPIAVTAAGRTIKVLTVGNSFADNALTFLDEIGESQGVVFVTGRANLGGAPLDRHARHLAAALADPTSEEACPYSIGDGRKANLLTILDQEKWDFVTIQQASFHSFDETSYEPYATNLVKAINEHAPSAEILVHETWAYREDDPWFSDPKKTDGSGPEQPTSQAEMYRRLVRNYEALASRHGLRILPVGDAFQLARDTPEWTFWWPDPKFNYTSPAEGAVPRQPGSLNEGWHWQKDSATGTTRFIFDGHHANLAGCYLAGLVWYEVMAGCPPAADVWHPETLSAEQTYALMRVAHGAVKARR